MQTLTWPVDGAEVETHLKMSIIAFTTILGSLVGQTKTKPQIVQYLIEVKFVGYF